MNKLPKITLWFWIMKIAATTLGETAGDLLSITLKVGYGVSSLILGGFFLLTLLTQLRVKNYHPFLYWTVILATSTAGTTLSDYMDRTLQLGYTNGAAILLSILLFTFAFWLYSGDSLSVNEIKSKKVELLYWIAILFSNTLGTATGDFLAADSGLGFAKSAFLIGNLLALTCLAYFYTKISRVFLFWFAFVLTRPFGATVGDVLTKAKNKGGLDLGTLGSSAVLGGILVAVILFTSYREKRANPRCVAQLHSA